MTYCRGVAGEMSPIPKSNEPGNNPGASGDGKGEGELEPQPQGFDTVLIAGNLSSEDEGSEDGEEESNGYGGYQLLEQDPEPEHHGADEDSEDETEGEARADGVLNQEPSGDEEWSAFEDFQQASHTDPESTFTDFQRAGSTGSAQQDPAHPHLPAHLAKLLPTATPTPDPDTTARAAHTDTPISLEQRKKKMATDEQIRAAMAGFSLPTAAIPSWARSVNEDDWKKRLVGKIQDKTEDDLPSSTSTSASTQQKGDGGNG